MGFQFPLKSYKETLVSWSWNPLYSVLLEPKNINFWSFGGISFLTSDFVLNQQKITCKSIIF